MGKTRKILLILERESYRTLKRAAKKAAIPLGQFVYESAAQRAEQMKRRKIGFRG